MAKSQTNKSASARVSATENWVRFGKLRWRDPHQLIPPSELAESLAPAEGISFPARCIAQTSRLTGLTGAIPQFNFGIF
jgi:hypothetical protein